MLLLKDDFIHVFTRHLFNMLVYWAYRYEIAAVRKRQKPPVGLNTWTLHVSFLLHQTLNMTKTMTTQYSATVCRQLGLVRMTNLTSAVQTVMWAVKLDTIGFGSAQTHCCFMLLLLQAARKTRTKVNPPSTRCLSTQLFHTPVSWHVKVYCIYEMACTCRLRVSCSPGTDLGSQRAKWSHVCACQDYLCTQSVTVCSMYRDDPHCVYTKCIGLIQLFTSWLFWGAFWNESHSNISVINKKPR